MEVQVYKDPITKKVLEGTAVLITEDADGPDEFGNIKCMVLFSEGDPLVFRRVHESEIYPERRNG